MAQKPSIPKGTRDFGPAEMAGRNYIFDTIRSVFRTYGYAPIETPSMENLSTLLSNRTARKTRLAEATAPNAATEHLQICPVVDDLGGGYDHVYRPVGGIQVFHDARGDRYRRVVEGDDLPDCAVIVIFNIIKSGDIEAFMRCNIAEEIEL